jgi:hypothetical protein
MRKLFNNIDLDNYAISFENNKLNNNFIFNNVRFILPSYIEHITFHSMLAITENQQIISNSNSFIGDLPTHNNEYNRNKQGNYILSRINRTYEYLLNTPENDVIIDEAVYFLLDPFTETNIGHNLSILFERIRLYNLYNLNIAVVLPTPKLNDNIITIVNILLPDVKVILIQYDTIYLFTNTTYITTNLIFDINKNTDIILKLINGAIQKQPNIEQYKNKKICLIKNTNNKNIVNAYNCYEANNFFNEITKIGWICINPEIITITELICYLYFASSIITSGGGIFYGNAIYFNPNSVCKKIFLKLYDNIPDYNIEQYNFLHVEKNLDSQIPYILSNIN